MCPKTNQQKKYEHKIKEYESLMDQTYDCALATLLIRHGSVRANYFNEESYNNYLEKKNKKINHGKYSRMKDGLYTHHILEDEAENIGDLKAIRKKNFPYSYQKVENLVYADLVEHMILHALILKKNMGIEGKESIGLGGYKNALRRNVYSWYVESNDEMKLKILQGNRKDAFKRACLKKEDAEEICRLTNKLAGLRDSH